jgi:hypothetical protein
MINDLTIILKKRWPEMLLIIGFMAIGMFLIERLVATNPTSFQSPQTSAVSSMTQTTSFLYPMIAMVFCVLSLTLHLGFLATLNLNYDTPHDPTILIRIGRFFFWRVIRFHLLFALVFIPAAILFYSSMKFFLFRDTSMENIPPWAFLACRTVTVTALAKPFLLIPPIMICKNIMVLKATAIMPDYKIAYAKPLVAVFIAGTCVIAAITILHMQMDPKTILFDIVIAIKSIIFGIFHLLIGIIGIWFISGKQFGKLREIQEEPEAETQE